ncbi:helix-turn-helix domain-containing protein [Variovorax sp. PBL-E5]|uniref:helix-turn-helix domain-containing protein n=1 Tax=Variovorax sp. PBL-E5 TaxID=434014 RepID=UPI0013171295|nr:helix-turn-helix domain-containing protein [Variovorax sp. PBL-E5]VTU39403.1 BetR domain protein [Variovorax sp. PBL-E5]
MTDSTYPVDSTSETLAAQCVRALLDRHGVPRRKHSTVVTEVLKLSYSQGHRRLTTDATWTLEELRTLAEHHGESLAGMVSLGQLGEMQRGTLRIGTTNIACRFARGAPVHKPRPGALVAAWVESDWHVVPAEDNLTRQAYDIVRLVIEPASAASRRIAVLDDHTDSAETIAGYLKSAGYDAAPFTDLASITAASEDGHFDGYVLDWIIETNGRKDTVRQLVASIRSRDAHCPIVVLTGEVETGMADESDIATAMARYRLKFFEKPARLSIISAALAGSFSAA